MKIKAEKAPCVNEPPADHKAMNFSQNVLKLKLKNELFGWHIPHG